MSAFNLITIDKGASAEIIKDEYSLNKQGITKWLQSKNIITEFEIVTSYQDLLPWARTGGETYCTSFEISTNKQTKQIFIKALVTTSPERSLLDWVRRRNILSENGIPVSNWYYFGGAAIFEDYYPLTNHDISFPKILAIGHQLDQLGFSTLKFTDDIRGDKKGNPFYIDFGFDLGEPSENIKSTAREYLALKYPAQTGEINKFYAENIKKNISL